MDSRDPNYQLFLFLHGNSGDGSPLRVGEIPQSVAQALGWRTRTVFLSLRDAQKIRHHKHHAMNAEKGLLLPQVVKHGDYYQSNRRGHEQQIEVVLHEPDNNKRAYFLVLSRNAYDTGIFLRTFYFSGEITRSKMNGAKVLRHASGINYFKIFDL